MSRVILRSKKEEIVKEIYNKINLAKGFMIADYDKISVNLFAKLRKELISNKCEIKIYKNNFFKLALKEKKLEELNQSLIEKNSFVFCYEDFLKGAKLFYNFNKAHQKFQFKNGFYENKIISKEDLLLLAKLPSHQELVANFAMLLLSPLTKIILSLKEIIKNKENQG